MKKKHDPKAAARHALHYAQLALIGLGRTLPSVVAAAALVRKRRGKIVVTGVGKSAYVGMKFAATLTSLGEHAVFLHPVEALHGDLGMARKGDVLIAISYSGESPEVVRIAQYLSKTGLPLIAITNNKNSSLGRLARVVLLVVVSQEGSPLNLAPMASTTASLAVSDMLAAALVDPAQFGERHFARFHPGGSLGLRFTEVSKAMVKDIPIVSEQAALSRALSIITKKNRGIVGVVSTRGTLVGVVTDGDLRRFVGKNQSIAGRRAYEAMTKNPKTANAEDSLQSALNRMEEYKITSLFVIDGKRRPVGIVHIHDILSGNFA